MVVVGTLIMGAGVGPAMPNDSTYFMAFVPPMLRGRVSGLLSTAFYAGQFASPRVSAPLVARSGLEGAFAALGLIVIAIAGLLSASGVLRHRTALVS